MQARQCDICDKLYKKPNFSHSRNYKHGGNIHDDTKAAIITKVNLTIKTSYADDSQIDPEKLEGRKNKLKHLDMCKECLKLIMEDLLKNY